jgi:mannose-6-phosphate isomerase-like protein (cupin superfamily)
MSNVEMQTVQMTSEEMLKRIARRDQLKPSKVGYVDTILPGYERDTFNVIGTGVTEDTEASPAIVRDGDFTITHIRNKPGTRGALHSHPTLEVFIPLTGKWAFIWNDNSDFGKTEFEVEAGPGDVVSVPPGVMRCFKDVGTEEAWLIVIMGREPGRDDAGRVMWPKSVLAEAERFGIARDAFGKLLRK